MMLIVVQLVMKFPVINGTLRFIAAYRRTRRWTLSRAKLY